jgi:hypothetical protein
LALFLSLPLKSFLVSETATTPPLTSCPFSALGESARLGAQQKCRIRIDAAA